MKKVIISIAVMLLVGFVIYKTTKKEAVVKAENLEIITSFFASDELEGRDTGSSGIEKAATYIEKVFEESNVKPFFEKYRQNFTSGFLNGYNLVGYIEGIDPKLKNEFVVISAHYDHLGIIEEVYGDNIANGANDNASGTAGVLQMAQYFAKKKTNKRSMLFVFFSGEEKGVLGSKKLAKVLKEKNIDLYTMLNFEMIGVPFEDRDYMAFVSGYNLSNMSKKINEYAGSNLTGQSALSEERNIFKRADNYPFYEEFKVPCQTISSCDLSNYDYYHKVDDEVDKLDFNHMAKFINNIIPAIQTICNTPTKEIKLY